MTPRRQAQTPGTQHGGGAEQGRAHGRGGGLSIAPALGLILTTSPPSSANHGPTAPPLAVTSLGTAQGSTATLNLSGLSLASGDHVLVTAFRVSTDTLSFSDNGGNDYATHSGSRLFTVSASQMAWAYAELTSAATQITLTGPTGHTSILRAFKLSGLAVNAFDQSAGAAAETGNPSSGPTGVLAQADEMAFEIVALTTNTSTVTPDFPNDLGQVTNPTTGALSAAWKETAATTAVTATATVSPSTRWVCQVVTLRRGG